MKTCAPVVASVILMGTLVAWGAQASGPRIRVELPYPTYRQ